MSQATQHLYDLMNMQIGDFAASPKRAMLKVYHLGRALLDGHRIDHDRLLKLMAAEHGDRAPVNGSRIRGITTQPPHKASQVAQMIATGVLQCEALTLGQSVCCCSEGARFTVMHESADYAVTVSPIPEIHATPKQELAAHGR